MKHITPKAIIIGLGLLSTLAILQPIDASTYFHFAVSTGSPGWRQPHNQRWRDWCYWHPNRCSYSPHHYWHRRWVPGQYDYYGYWHPGHWMRW